MKIGSSVVLLALIILVAYQQVKPQTSNTSNGFDLVDKAGNIRKPADYRTRYESLGTYTVLRPKGHQMHLKYASPRAIEYYRKNGKFADGTVLFKEVFETDQAKLTTG